MTTLSFHSLLSQLCLRPDLIGRQNIASLFLAVFNRLLQMPEFDFEGFARELILGRTVTPGELDRLLESFFLISTFAYTWQLWVFGIYRFESLDR